MEKMMKKFKITVLMTLCLALMGISTAVHAQTEVTLTAWTADQLYLDYFNSRLPDFQALHPELKITFNGVADSSAPANALNAIAANPDNPGLPDMLGMERAQFGNYMKEGIVAKYFLDLTDLVAADRSDYSEGRMAIYTYDGKLYGLESQLAASLLYYQPDVFTAAGVDVPTTWEQVINDVGPKLAAKGSAFSFATNDGDWFLMFFDQRGGFVFDKDGNFVMGDDTNKPLAVEVATALQKGIQNGTFMVVLGGNVWSGADIPTAYTSGKLAGTVMPDWWATCCLEPDAGPDMSGKWKVAVPPVWEGGGHSTLTWGGTGWMVSSQSPNAALAKEFLAFAYLGLESQVKKFQQINNFPWYIPAFADPRVKDLADPYFSNQHLGEFYGQVAADVPVWYNSPFFPDVKKALADNLPGLFDGSLTPEAFVETAIKTSQDAIDFGS
jgi:ABC-type glycerol-3-phosphate transport system substrate-binding protein